MDRYLSTQQVADLVGSVNRTTVLRWVEEGVLEALVIRVHDRPTIRIKESAVAAFLARYADQPHCPGDHDER